mmetsp:Transcript_3748/g.10165  ORF Transcript_3748/g.10165 Transcript_3748/m.10165 type:complete len:332 (+) Transcript_3748:5299-6294(+)
MAGKGDSLSDGAVPPAGANFKAWMHALLQKHGAKTKRASEPPAMAPCHANDVESGHCTPASSSGVHQLARASDQALSGSLALKAKQGNPLQGVDFVAAKQRITALWASQRQEDKEESIRLAHLLNMVFSASTASRSLKTNLEPTARKQRRVGHWMQRHDKLLHSAAEGVGGWLVKVMSGRHADYAPNLPALPESALDCAAAGTAASHGLPQAPGSAGHSPDATLTQPNCRQDEAVRPVQGRHQVVNSLCQAIDDESGNFGDPALDMEDIREIEIRVPGFGRSSLPPWRRVAEDIVNLTVETTTFLHQIQAACLGCEEMVGALQALLQARTQ